MYENIEGQNQLYKSKKIIRISEEELDSPIYRVFSKHWLLDALTRRSNALVKPQMWDDPFENFILQSTAETDKGEIVGFEFIKENYYGQCWTFSKNETDTLWRIYSPNKDGFRVKTTIRKLFDTFYDVKHQWAMLCFYIGRILYENEIEIKRFFEDPDNLRQTLFDTSGNGLVETLLIKRLEFEHENELRLIFAGHDSWYDTKQKTYEFPIDINFHFEEILADPRMDEFNFLNTVDEIRALGYKNPVNKSKLYQIPNLNLRLHI
jgi:hypothetical protein